MIVPVLVWRRQSHLKAWTFCSALLMGACIISFFGYMYCRANWTCNYGNDRVVIGSEYTAEVLQAEGGQTDKDCFTMLREYPGGPELIWKSESIEKNRILLSLVYVTCIPLFAACVIAVTQAVHCATKV